MTKNVPRPLMCLALTSALAGCTPYVLAPPARTIPLESVKVLDKGQTGIKGEIGGGLDGGGITRRAL